MIANTFRPTSGTRFAKEAKAVVRRAEAVIIIGIAVLLLVALWVLACGVGTSPP